MVTNHTNKCLFFRFLGFAPQAIPMRCYNLVGNVVCGKLLHRHRSWLFWSRKRWSLSARQPRCRLSLCPSQNICGDTNRNPKAPKNVFLIIIYLLTNLVIVFNPNRSLGLVDIYNASKLTLSCCPIARNSLGVMPVTCLNCEDRCAGELYPSV